MRWLLLPILALSACAEGNGDTQDTDDTTTASDTDVGVGDTDTSDLLCEAVLTGAVTQTLRCDPSDDAEYVKLSWYGGVPGSTLGGTVPTVPPNTGYQVNVVLMSTVDAAKGMQIDWAEGSNMVSVIQFVDNDVVRQWGAFHDLGSPEDQGALSATVSDWKVEAQAADLTLVQPWGTLTATLPVVPGYDAGDAIELTLTFAPKL
jgi:hypothetical protein